MNTCQKCNFWSPESPVAQAKENMGECNKLSVAGTDMNEDFLLPVLNKGEVKGTEILTAATFGCNQFAQA
jgi:uncharacterized protein YuzE